MFTQLIRFWRSQAAEKNLSVECDMVYLQCAKDLEDALKDMRAKKNDAKELEELKKELYDLHKWGEDTHKWGEDTNIRGYTPEIRAVGLGIMMCSSILNTKLRKLDCAGGV